jgi:acylphosphatase
VRRRYLVAGAVQGVGFRHFTWRQGRRLGLHGWVRNLPDGSVEAVAEGDEGRLAQFEAELSRGPLLASVTQLRRSEIPAEGEPLSSFEIR